MSSRSTPRPWDCRPSPTARGRLSAAQDSARVYTHPKPKLRVDPDGHARFEAAGCRIWNVESEELETKVKDLIVQQRSWKGSSSRPRA
jgi:hypothetical protein